MKNIELKNTFIEQEGIGNHLSEHQVRSYQSQGFHFPVKVMSASEAADYRKHVEEIERSIGKLSNRHHPLRQKSHLLFPWLDKLIRTPVLLDAVEDVLESKNLLVWNTDFFIKEPNDPSFVTFHQDSVYWGLGREKILTAWIGFTDSTKDNGALQVIPGTHHGEQLPHRRAEAAHNMLLHNQEVDTQSFGNEPVLLELKAGEASLHDVRLVHGSDPNRSNDRRMGFAVRYISTSVRPTHGLPDHATLVRGADHFGNFILESPPQCDADMDTVKMMGQYFRVMTAAGKISDAEDKLRNS